MNVAGRNFPETSETYGKRGWGDQQASVKPITGIATTRVRTASEITTRVCTNSEILLEMGDTFNRSLTDLLEAFLKYHYYSKFLQHLFLSVCKP